MPTTREDLEYQKFKQYTGGVAAAKVAPDQTSSAACTNVAGAAADTQLVAANANRRALILVNDSSANAYVKYGTGASNSSYTFKMDPGGTLVLDPVIYTGQVNALWDAAAGNMRVTEL